jgi:3-oxoacyl-[acyl-carrier protein] reductase
LSIYSKDALQGKHALIIGASGGIGSETARTLVSMGADVTLTGRNSQKLKQVQQTLVNKFPNSNVEVYVADILNENERTSLVQYAEETVGPISLLVNNAGIFRYKTVEDLTEEDLVIVMQVNYTATVLLTQLVYKEMKARNEGNIVNVSSLSGLRGTFGNTAYSASKFALIGFTHSMAVEAIRNGVRVNAVCPGFVDTDMAHEVIGEHAKLKGQTFENQFKNANDAIPSGRITTPQEVANTIAFLLSDASENIIGESVKISGGSVLG